MKNSMNISLSPVLSDYELLDSGDFEKLERFGQCALDFSQFVVYGNPKRLKYESRRVYFPARSRGGNLFDGFGEVARC